jgi:hypothetical protein
MNQRLVDAVLDVDESSPSFLAVGYCDIVVQGLSAGSVKLQYKLKPTTALPAPAWVDFPDGSFSADTYTTVFFSEHGVNLRLTGVGNNDTVYVRLASFVNR